MMEIRVDPYLIASSPSNTFIKLKERDGSREINFTVSPASVYYFFKTTKDVDLGQPVIHKAMIDVLKILGAKIEKVVVDHFASDMFLCHVYVKIAEQTHILAIHITDAIILAVVQGCPLFVLEDVFNKSAERQVAGQADISNEKALEMFEDIDPKKLPS